MIFNHQKLFQHSGVPEFFVSNEVSEEKLKHFFLVVYEILVGVIKPAVIIQVWQMVAREKFL